MKYALSLFSFSIYLHLLEQELRNAVDYQDEGLLTEAVCDYT